MISLLAHFYRGPIRSRGERRRYRNGGENERPVIEKKNLAEQWRAHKDVLRDEEGKQAFLSGSFNPVFVFFLVNKGEPRWHIHPLWDAGRG